MWIFFFFFFFFGGGDYEIGLVFYLAFFIFLIFFFGGGGDYEIGLVFYLAFFLGGGGGEGGSFLYILGLFKVKYKMRILFGAAKFQIFLGMPDIPDFFLFFYFFGGGGGWGWGLTVNAGSKPMYEEKLRVPNMVSLGTDLYFYSSLVWRARD